MKNLRIIWDNAVDRATLSASTTSSALAVTNLQSDKKSSVWRATGTSARLSGTWPSLESVQGIAAVFCNWSPTATWRVRLTSEPQATNLLTYSNDFTNAAWAKTALTLTAGVAGPDGTNSATTLTATAANAEIYQTASNSGSAKSSVWIRRRTGTGAISVRNTANTAWIALSVTGNWQRLGNDGGTHPSLVALDILIATSGDAIDIAFAQVEPGSTATSYYPTTSAAATRPLGYIDSWQSYTYDSGSVAACPAPAVTLRGWTAAQSSSAYAYGGGAIARMWLPTATSAYGIAIDITDASNLQGYIEAARLVVGPYWSPAYNTKTLSETYVDAAVHYRTDAGDLMTDASTIHKKVPIEFEYLPASDRTQMANILRASRAYPIFLSVFPENSDLDLERAHTVYGKRMSDSDIESQAAILYGSKVEIESV